MTINFTVIYLDNESVIREYLKTYVRMFHLVENHPNERIRITRDTIVQERFLFITEKGEEYKTGVKIPYRLTYTVIYG